MISNISKPIDNRHVKSPLDMSESSNPTNFQMLQYEGRSIFKAISKLHIVINLVLSQSEGI